MYNYDKFGAQIGESRDNLFGRNLDPEVRPGWGPLPALNFDPARTIKCEENEHGEVVPVGNIVETTETK